MGSPPSICRASHRSLRVKYRTFRLIVPSSQRELNRNFVRQTYITDSDGKNEAFAYTCALCISSFSMPELPYSLEEECTAVFGSGKKEGKKCTNKAAYYQPTKKGKILIRCGVHCKKEARLELKKNPHAAKQREEMISLHMESVEEQALKNRRKGVPGDVIVEHLAMMRKVPIHEGYLNVFPNYRHGGRKDGLGVPELSPMKLGPVVHHGPCPSATIVENYYQSSKVYPQEVDEEFDPLPCYYEMKRKMFLDDTPHRHKFPTTSGAKVKPLYSIHHNEQGKEIRLTYVQSRYFYCTAYTQLAVESKAFAALQKKIRKGYNLCITGYDGYDVKDKDLYDCYKDPSRPFGHELVLYCLLTMTENEWPWVRFRRRHKAVYR